MQADKGWSINCGGREDKIFMEPGRGYKFGLFSCSFPFWDKVWGSPLPVKVKFFAWKLVLEIIPTKQELQKKGMSFPLICDVCLEEDESQLHLFRDCEWGKRLWIGLNMNYGLDWGRNNCNLWLLQGFKYLEGDKLSLFLAKMWWIWVNKNATIFGNVIMSTIKGTGLVRMLWCQLVGSPLIAKQNIPEKMNKSTGEDESSKMKVLDF
ncbi:hypothetical protein ACFE04_026516 [Oxalis oulophora]